MKSLTSLQMTVFFSYWLYNNSNAFPTRIINNNHYTSNTSFRNSYTSTSIHSSINPIHDNPTKEKRNKTLTLSLNKPIGIVLEDIILQEESSPIEKTEGECNKSGVLVDSIIEGGSAFQHIDKLVGLKIMKVFSDDVQSLTCSEVQEKINAAPSPVTIEFTSNFRLSHDRITSHSDNENESFINKKNVDNHKITQQSSNNPLQQSILQNSDAIKSTKYFHDSNGESLTFV